jgi:hypothetical protein
MASGLIDRVTDDLASGRSVDWPAVMASAANSTERQQLESLRLVHQLARRHIAKAQSGVISTTMGPPVIANTVASTSAEWGRYRLLQEAGSGSFGTVYRAVDPDLDLQIAIKVLHRHIASDLLKEGLLKEGRALARIRHENVVRVLGVEFKGDRVGLCTEFINGDTLENEVRMHGTFSQAQAIEVGKAVCQALAAVHRAGFIHRDVKARNVMRERDTGRVVLMDFGTGREFEHELTPLTFRIEGTAIYMAPEVLASQQVSHSSDVYSVGVLLYYVLTAAYPVEGASVEELKAAHGKRLHTPLGDRRPDLSPAFLRVVERAVAPKESRFATPAALCDELEKLATDHSLWYQRLRLAVVTAATVFGVLATLGFISTFYFNTVLGRTGFVDEGILDWLMWGARGILAPVVIAGFTLLVITLVLECAGLVARISAHARKAERSAASLLHRLSLDDIVVLSSASLLASAAALFGTWWYFAPLFGTLTSIFPDIATVSLDRLKLLSPDYGDYHVSYRKAFVGTTIACVMLWYPPVRLAIRTRKQMPRRVAIAGAIVLAFSLILLDFPYRLLTHDIDFAEVSWNGRACHVFGERSDDRLIFCGSLPVPRSRIVKAETLIAHPAPADEGQALPGSVDAKKKRSIFKFMLNNSERRVREEPVR